MQILRNTNINFINQRKFSFVLSGVLVILSVVLMFIKPPRWGIDFTGGSLIHLKFVEAPSEGDLRMALENGGIPKAGIQRFGKSQVMIVKIKGEVHEEVAKDVDGIIKAQLPGMEFEILRSEMIGPVVGEMIKEKAVKAFILAFIGMIIYVTFRYKGGIWGLAAIIALIHDVIITFGVLNFFGATIDLPVMAGLLTLAGYSINDTIVIYDRIRENIRLHYKMPLGEVINKSINETLSRTIVTSGTTLVVVLALFFKGGEVLHGFSLALLSGVIIGTYSSVSIASSLVYIWQTRGLRSQSQ